MKEQHEEAIRLSHNASVCNDYEQSIQLYKQAFALEKEVAENYLKEKGYTLGASILFKSACNLALKARLYNDVRSMISQCLNDKADKRAVGLQEQLKRLRKVMDLFEKQDSSISQKLNMLREIVWLNPKKEFVVLPAKDDLEVIKHFLILDLHSQGINIEIECTKNRVPHLVDCLYLPEDWATISSWYRTDEDTDFSEYLVLKQSEATMREKFGVNKTLIRVAPAPTAEELLSILPNAISVSKDYKTVGTENGYVQAVSYISAHLIVDKLLLNEGCVEYVNFNNSANNTILQERYTDNRIIDACMAMYLTLNNLQTDKQVLEYAGKYAKL